MNKIVPDKLKKTITSVIIILALTVLLFALASCKNNSRQTAAAGNDATASISITETTGTVTETTSQTETTSLTTAPQSQQIIEVTAKTGGYSPGKVEAKAGVPTILVMTSDGAYGCERAFNIFDSNSKKVLVSQILPENGKTEFDLGIQAKGAVLLGVCSMGMYYFQITFD